MKVALRIVTTLCFMAYVMGFASLTPALATCSGGNPIRATVDAFDRGTTNAIGTQGIILVNDLPNSEIQFIARAVGVYTTGTLERQVLAGWILNPDGFGIGQAVPAITWTYPGADNLWGTSNTILGASSDYMAKGTAHQFKINDSDGDGRYKGYVDNHLIGTTPDVGLASGRPITHTFSLVDCDTGYSHFWNLGKCTGRCSSYANWSTLRCFVDHDQDYHLDRTTDREHYVRQGQSQNGCDGSTGGG
jgi:hypothetical protein